MQYIAMVNVINISLPPTSNRKVLTVISGIFSIAHSTLQLYTMSMYAESIIVEFAQPKFSAGSQKQMRHV